MKTESHINWISPQDKLPEESERVLIVNDGKIDFGYIWYFGEDGPEWRSDDNDFVDPDFWASLKDITWPCDITDDKVCKFCKMYSQSPKTIKFNGGVARIYTDKSRSAYKDKDLSVIHVTYDEGEEYWHPYLEETNEVNVDKEFKHMSEIIRYLLHYEDCK